MLKPVRHPFPVYYCRHGQTDWNRADRLQGHSDIPLNSHGEAQARAYGRALKEMDVDWTEVTFYSSPLVRAQKTMALLLNELGPPMRNWRVDDRLIELHLGDWNGMAIRDVEKEYATEWAARKESPWLAPVPGGESYGEAEPRLREFAMSLKGPSLVVGHGGTGRVLRGLLTHGDPAEFLKHGTRQDRVYILENGEERSKTSIF